MRNCLLCGVGGQGTVLASRILAEAAMAKNISARTAETIGMAQRGGCVVSHVRLGGEVHSPLIPPGQADAILGFEPGEAVRSLPWLKPHGVLVVCDLAIAPIAALASGGGYDGAAMVRWLTSQVENCYVVDGAAIAAACGSHRVINTALLGAVAASGALDLSPQDIEAAILKRIKPQFAQMNQQALALGVESVKERQK